MENDRPVLVVIAGPNGSGKTTLTQKLLSHEWGADCTYINPDQIAQEKFGNWNSEEAVLKAAQFATELRYNLLEKRTNIVFETVLSSEEKLDYIRKAKAAGYFIRVFFISTSSPAINAKRIADRYMEGGHSVPIEKIVSRFSKSIVNCAAIMGMVDRLYIYDNSIDDHMARLLFRVSDGCLSKQYEQDIPLWARPLLKLVL